MIKASTANQSSFEVTNPSSTEIQMTRLFDAPTALVFEVMTEPEHVREWWGRLGEGYSVPVCEVDLRPGGRWRFVNRHPKGEAVFYGEYREVTPPDRLVFTEIYQPFPDSISIVTSVLTEEGSQTRLTAIVAYPSEQVRDMVIASGMAKGAGISYDRLEDLLSQLQTLFAGRHSPRGRQHQHDMIDRSGG